MERAPQHIPVRGAIAVDGAIECRYLRQSMADPVPAHAIEHPISETYTRANRLNAKLASGTSAELIREGRQVADDLVAHVRARVESFDDFVKRVELSEEFSLTESRQVSKAEKELKIFYLRAASLREAANEAEARARRNDAR